jgi:hypothetical protein
MLTLVVRRKDSAAEEDFLFKSANFACSRAFSCDSEAISFCFCVTERLYESTKDIYHPILTLRFIGNCAINHLPSSTLERFKTQKQA